MIYMMIMYISMHEYCKLHNFYDFHVNSITSYLGFMRFNMSSSNVDPINIISHDYAHFKQNFIISSQLYVRPYFSLVFTYETMIMEFQLFNRQYYTYER